MQDTTEVITRRLCGHASRYSKPLHHHQQVTVKARSNLTLHEIKSIYKHPASFYTRPLSLPFLSVKEVL
jgi:hypothetical protein